MGYHFCKNKPYKGKKDKNITYRLELERKLEIQRWRKEIGFSNPKHSSKFKLWELLGYYIPRTNLRQRMQILNCAGVA